MNMRYFEGYDSGQRLDAINHSGTRQSYGRYFFWAVLGTIAIYALAHASLTVWLVIGGILLALLGLATAVCVHAQNNDPWW
jgi:uncharacterized membrane protein (Fun14 family)